MAGPALPDPHHAAIAAALGRLDLATKISILAGRDTWSLPEARVIGLRPLVMSDGPVGVRGLRWTTDDPSIALPSPTALAATWDVALARTAGRLLGQEARRKGVHVLLAPTVNLHRTPRGGRHFECYSEDPVLTGELAASYVAGVQDHSVAAAVKHFVGNDSETDRMSVDVHIDERTLREVYLAPFETIVGRGGAWGVMAAYNGVNGAAMTEHADLLRGVLKGEWGFDGFVVSDWTAARSTAPTALAGLDIAMPAIGNPWGDQLRAAVRDGAVPAEVIDEMVRRVLLLAARVGALHGVPPAVPEADRPAELDGRAVARDLATRSFVLARNRDGLLPLDAGALSRVAVLGALARDARILGGGSAQVYPARVSSPLDGLRAALPAGVRVEYAVGADPRGRLPIATSPQWIDLGVVFRDADGNPLHTAPLATLQGRWMDDLPDGVTPANLRAVELRGTLTPQTGGEHVLGIAGIGEYALTVAGAVRFDGVVVPDNLDPAAFLTPPEHRVPVELAAGEPVEVVLSQRIDLTDAPILVVSLALGYTEPQPDPDRQLDEAVRLGASADVAVVVVGTTEEVESEGFDRATLDLPGRQDELVSRVAAANPRTVVVVNAGSPVLLPWVDEVAAVLLTWFPGQEAGDAIADVLLGVAEPGGRMPTTWPRRMEDCPVLTVEPVDGRLEYAEGVFVGYRAWDRRGVAPLFEFGHGLGYTTWSYEELSVDQGIAHVRVRNTGTRAGHEVVQLYLSPVAPDDDRPVRWLAGFAVATAAPGEAVTVTVPIAERSTQIWDGGWRTVPGRYLVEAAHSLGDRRLSTTIEV